MGTQSHHCRYLKNRNVGLNEQTLTETAPWLRLAFALCTVLAGTGTVLASPVILWSLAPIAALGAASLAHPFDLIYNHGIRYFTKTRPLPKRGAPNRFACGLGAAWLVATGFAFHSGDQTVGYILGGTLVLIGMLVSTIDFCIPSLIYRTIFGFPPKSGATKANFAPNPGVKERRIK